MPNPNPLGDLLGKILTPEMKAKIQAAAEEATKRKLLALASIFDDLRTQEDVISCISGMLDLIQDEFAAQVEAGHMDGRACLKLSAAFTTAGACLRTMKANPLYGTSALSDQLRHHFAEVVRRGTVIVEISSKEKNHDPGP